MSSLSWWAERARILAGLCALVTAGLFAYQGVRAVRGQLRLGTLQVGGPPGAEEEPERPLQVGERLTAPTHGAPSARMQLLVDASNAPDARVWVDGDQVGTTPWAGDVGCEPGAQVQIRIEARGHVQHLSYVRCAPGELMRVRPRLRRTREDE